MNLLANSIQVKGCQRLPASHQQLRERHGIDSPSHPQEESALPTPRHLDLGLLTSVSVGQYILFFKLLGVRYFVAAALANENIPILLFLAEFLNKITPT